MKSLSKACISVDKLSAQCHACPLTLQFLSEALSHVSCKMQPMALGFSNLDPICIAGEVGVMVMN